ncbi:MAG: flagellar motor protein MotA [Candidatus Midichloriaceae bacterium]|jgi:chemotaxis protein MotA|nr:flagellar motor protein MotA [Candidatus Midichloriaceae bacterium]
MLPIIGIVITLITVFGGYIGGGGKIQVILHALPIELTMIFGASLGAYIVGNKTEHVKGGLGDIGMCFKGTKWDKQDYSDLLCLMFAITKTMKTKGLLAIEEHIENPVASSIFSQYPKIAHDHFACDFICDTLRLVTMSLEDPIQIEDAMKQQLDKHHHEILGPSSALQGMADGLPAIGIVVAVLGVIKTMASIDKPPTILGEMIGGALVGTFLGVFLAYCFIGPFANKAKVLREQDGQFYMIIRDIIIAHLKGNPAQVSVEIGRGNVPSKYQPSFSELEQRLSEVKT